MTIHLYVSSVYAGGAAASGVLLLQTVPAGRRPGTYHWLVWLGLQALLGLVYILAAAIRIEAAGLGLMAACDVLVIVLQMRILPKMGL